MRNYLAFITILFLSVIGYTAADRVIQTQKLHVSEPAASGTSKVILTAPALASDYTLTLPASAGSNGYVSVTNGSGVMDWVNTLTGFTLASPTITGATITSPTITSPSLSGATLTGSTTFSALTATTVPYLNGSKVLTSSAVTPTELGYLSGVTSAIQTQMDLKAPLASPSFTGNVTIGDMGTEGSGINVGGTTYASTFKVSDINGSHYAQTILHRHSTTLEPLILGARSNSNTSAHGDVTAGQNLFTIYGSGYAGSNYKLFGGISIGASSTGTISNTSAPGRIHFYTTSNTSTNPNVAFALDQDKSASFYGLVNLGVNTASRALVTDASKNITTSATTATQLGYLSTTTGDVQTQLNSKMASTVITAKGDLVVGLSANTPTGFAVGTDGYSLVADSTQPAGIKWAAPGAAAPGGSNTQVQYNSAGVLGGDAGMTYNDATDTLSVTTGVTTGTLNATTVNASGLTASRAVVTDGSKNLSSSTVTSTELGYVSGVTSAIQTQLNSKVDSIGDSIGSATVGSILFAGAAGVLAQDNSNLFWDDTNNRLGVGTTAPTSKVTISDNTTLSTPEADTKLHIGSSSGNAASVLIETHGTGIAPNIYARKAYGTVASPSATGSGVQILNLAGQTYGTSSYASNVALRFHTAEAQTETARGSYITLNTTATGSTTLSERMRVDAAGNITFTAIHNNASPPTNTTQTISSGTWTPSITNTTNVASSSTFVGYYSRVGNVVTCSGYLEIDPTSAGVSTSFRISLPIASDMAGTLNAIGTLKTNLGETGGHITSDAGSDTAVLTYIPASAAAAGLMYTFQYLVQ